MKTLVEVLKLSADYLEKQGIGHGRRQAEELLSHVLHLPRMELYLQFDRPLEERELDLCRRLIVRRAKGEPLAYLLGYVEFLDCRIEVNPSVLIPRQETEILVDKVAVQLAKEDLKDKRLLDLCCGSCCVGISLKKRFPDLQVSAIDISPEALQVARRNAESNDVAVEFFQGDFLAPVKDKKFDYVICNPPYVSDQEYDELDPQVRCFEPKGALVGGADGADFYRRACKELPAVLQQGARVWLEIGQQQGSVVFDLFNTSPWSNCQIEKDWAGKDRFCSFSFLFT